jgi:hypothetical protein
MFYSGSVSPPREPPKKKFVILRRRPVEAMGDNPSSSSGGGVKETSLMWPMLTRDNYTEWAMLMQ